MKSKSRNSAEAVKGSAVKSCHIPKGGETEKELFNSREGAERPCRVTWPLNTTRGAR